MAFPIAAAMGIQAGAGLLGGYLQQRAANKAAKTLAKTGSEVAKSAYDTSESIARDLRELGEDAGANSWLTANTGAGAIEGAAEGAATGVEGSVTDANALLRSIYEGDVGLTDPYTGAGAGAVTTLAEMARNPEQFQFDDSNPAYQFRLQEGLKALEKSAAGRGILNSGSTLKGITNYAGAAASQEYENAFQRFMQQQEQRTNTLSALTGYGLSATGLRAGMGETYGGRAAGNVTRGAEVAGGLRLTGAQSGADLRQHGVDTAGQFRVGTRTDAGQLRMQGETLAGNARIGAGTATAAGQVAGGQAWGNMLSNTGSDIGGMLFLRDLLTKRPDLESALV